MTDSISRMLGIPDDAVVVHSRIRTGTCPRCGTPFSMRRPIEANALSRCTRSGTDAWQALTTPLYVCSPCGVDEAFQQMAGVLDPPSAWVNPPPVTD